MTVLSPALGLGFNPGFLDETLALPDTCQYIEAGPSLFKLPHQLAPLGARHLSLHLARAPFCERETLQIAFVEEVAEFLSPAVSSIGLHLCGPYRTGLGELGLGSDFIDSEMNRASSYRLLALLQQRVEQPLLIENANFYDRSSQQAIRITEFSNQLCEQSGAKLILDLAHLIMNAHNVGLDPYYLLGKVDLHQVSVIHLSGIVEGRDGVYHDGHSRTVHPAVWTMLEQVLLLVNPDITVVLEHSDSDWCNYPDKFVQDWDKLSATLQASPQPSFSQQIDLSQVGLGYLSRIVLPKRFPQLYEALGQPDFSALVRLWGERFKATLATDAEQYVAMVKSKHLEDYPTLYVCESFSNFINQLRGEN